MTPPAAPEGSDVLAEILAAHFDMLAFGTGYLRVTTDGVEHVPMGDVIAPAPEEGGA